MRILIPIFSPPTGAMGPHTRALAVGSQALELGHDVAFCASGKIYQSLREQHYNAFQIPEPTFFGLPKCLSRFVEKRFGNGPHSFVSGKSFGNIWLVLILLGMAKSSFLKELVKIQLNAVKAFQPDVIFTELDPAAYLVSEITGIPLSTTFAKVALEGIDTFAYRRLSKVAHDILRSYGRPQTALSELCFGSKILKIIPSIPELDGTSPTKPDVCYVGNLLKNKQPTQRTPIRIEHGKKYIFAYFGAGSIGLGRVKTILPQIFTSHSPYRCVVASERFHQQHTIGVVTFLNYVPAGQVLPHCAWTICHGGHNTIVQSILHRVPLLVFPGVIFERRFNAQMVEESGCGYMGEASNFTKSWIEEKLPFHEQTAQKAKTLCQKFESFGGARTAIEAIEHLVNT